MNLDDHKSFQEIDRENMLAHIDNLPEQLLSAWELGQHLDLPKWTGIEQILIAGLGGSAIGADLLSAYVAPQCPVPIIVHRDYSLPAWAHSERTLLIASSHSGNTEETLSAFEEGVSRGCRCLSVTTGGQLSTRAEETQSALWMFEHKGQPRAAVGYSFGLLLSALTRLKLIPNQTMQVEGAVDAMRKQQPQLSADNPAALNPAKRMAGQLVGRWVTIIGSGMLAPVARRWKGQINELAKAWAHFDVIPENNHNTVAGIVNPEEIFAPSMVLFLRAPSYHPRNTLRTDITKRLFMLEGLNTDFVDAQGKSPMDHLWTVLHLGDYTAYYLAMAYGVDPTPVETIQGLKSELADSDQA
ncbi:MAG: bifunctional phosphoglucose/phosphomannose isomerase [Anaerolineales bacterium]